MSLETPIIHPRVLNKKDGGAPSGAVSVGRPSISRKPVLHRPPWRLPRRQHFAQGLGVGGRLDEVPVERCAERRLQRGRRRRIFQNGPDADHCAEVPRVELVDLEDERLRSPGASATGSRRRGAFRCLRVRRCRGQSIVPPRARDAGLPFPSIRDASDTLCSRRTRRFPAPFNFLECGLNAIRRGAVQRPSAD